MKMRHNHDAPFSHDEAGHGTSGRDRRQTPGSPSALEKAVRATTAIVVFGIPLAVGTATVLGYGAYSLYKRLRRFAAAPLPEEKR